MDRLEDSMKLSIIVPVYNLENYVSRTLDSLLTIRFSHDYEIIVVNDGSTDRSEAVIAGYQEKTDKIHLYSIENRGLPGARNYGVSKAVGEYITYVDGDDTVDPDFFEKAVAELDSGGYDFVQGNFRLIYEDREEPREFVKQDMVISDRKEMLRLYLKTDQLPICCCACGKVYRGEIARRIPFDNTLVNAEDVRYIFDILCAADKIKLLKDVSIHYLQRSTSIVHTLNAKKIYSKLKVVKHFRDSNSYQELTPLIEYRYLLTLQELYYYLCKEKDPRAKEVRREILRCPIRQLWPELDNTTHKRLLLHKFAGPLYDLYFRYLKK